MTGFLSQRGPTLIWTLILVLLIVLLVATFPVYPYSRNWGYYPASALALLLVVYLLLLWFGLVTFWYPGAGAPIEPAPAAGPPVETMPAD